MALPDLSLNLVDSVDSASAFLRWIGERRPCLAVDTETTGLSWFDTTRLVQFGDGQGGWAVPIRNWRGVAEAGLSAVKDGGASVIFHNSSYDLHKLENGGLPIPAASQVEDTLILSRLKDPHLPAGLKALCARLYGREAVAGQELLSQRMRENKWTWATVPDDDPVYYGYGILDTCLTALAFEHLRPLVPSQAYEREMAVLSVMYGAERRGLRIDVPYTENLLALWKEEAAALRSELQGAGIDNPGSNHQVTLHLRSAGWEPSEFTDKGAVKLDKDVLTALKGGPYGAVAEPLIRYRRLRDWSSTYLETFLRDMDETEHVHASINTLAAKTGRMSITGPPLQTLPSKEASIRNCIIPEEGHVLYAIDFSQIEMRMLAHYSGDVALRAAVEAEDLHRFCASLAYGVAEEDVTDLQRKIAKNTNFARVYGAGPQKIADTAGVPLEQIKGYMDAFDHRFPQVSRFMEQVEHTAKVRLAVEGQAYVTTSGGRRAVGEPDKLYALTNACLQGSAADVFKSAIVAVDCAGLGENVVAPIHDELLFSFPADTAAEQAAEAHEAMQDLTGFSVPLTCEVTGPLDRWGEAYE